MSNDHEDDVDESHSLGRADILRIGLLVGVATGLSFVGDLPPLVSLLIGALTLAVGAWAVFQEAIENIRERRMTMELSMAIAILAALLTGETFVALVIAAFVVVAEILEGMAVARGRNAIRDLLAYLPLTALIRRDGATVEVPYEAVQTGDLVLVNPATTLAVDGIVVSGKSRVDEATITGEPVPVLKAPGAVVYAGTINQLGALEVRTERVGRDTTFGKIVETVERAERSRAPVQRVADRLAGYLVVFALASAGLTFVITRDLTATISVVIVAGACGVAAGTPLAILGAIGRAARNGVVIKGGRYVEGLWDVNVVVLDKTGTLTAGRPEVIDVVAIGGHSKADVIAAAAFADLRSEHPLGRSIVEHAATQGVAVDEPESFEALPGRGVSASVQGVRTLVGTRTLMTEHGVDVATLAGNDGADSSSHVYVARGGLLLGTIRIEDPIRPEAAAAVGALTSLGMKIVLLSGDRQEATSSVGRRVGISEAVGDLLPDQKAELVREMVASGRRVAMVGDGVNDAPALAEATVGIAMGSGTDFTREGAGIVLIGNDLTKFVETVALSRKTRGIIIQNFAGTILVDVLGIALAALGILGPLVAVVIHVGSELAFIMNAARLVPGRSAAPSTTPTGRGDPTLGALRIEETAD
jgi:heavy metal translocating P-type ATPase